MKRAILLTFALALPFAAGGCYAHAHGHASVSVRRAPPPLRVEVRPPMPYHGAYWVDGYWGYRGNDYYWVSGHYVRPRSGYVYVRPRWERRGSGYVYVDGGWRGRGSVRAAPAPRRQSYDRRQDTRVRGSSSSTVRPSAPPRGRVEHRQAAPPPRGRGNDRGRDDDRGRRGYDRGR